MRPYRIALSLVTVLVCGAFAQQGNVAVTRSLGSPSNEVKSEKKAIPEPTSQERKRGLRMMADTESSVRGMESATQALALTQMSKAYATADKKKAIELLKDALTQASNAVLEIPDESAKNEIRTGIQEKVLSALLPLDPAYVEQMLNEVDPDTRKVILKQLLAYYQDNKQDDKAIDILERIARDDEMPYGPAASLMSHLTSEQNAELRRLFTDALNSYDLHDDGKSMRMGGSFPSLITKFHNQLPPELTRQAIDTVLAHAKKADEPQEGGTKPSISVASKKGAVQFDSKYEYELFELLPTIQEIDPAYAERLLKENQEAKTFLVKFPGGLSALTAADDGGKDPTVSMMYNDGAPPRNHEQDGGQGGGSPEHGPSPLDMQAMAKIEGEAATHPSEAMALVPTISRPNLQAQAYIAIAHSALKKDSSTSRSALKKVMEIVPKLAPTQQVMLANNVAAIYQRMGDADSARGAVEKSVDLANSVYKQDTNADDPNKAPKWYWPSTAAWRSAMVVATKIDPVWAQGLLKDIPDDDIRALNRMAIASEMLKIPMNLVETMQIQKSGINMMRMRTNADDE